MISTNLNSEKQSLSPKLLIFGNALLDVTIKITDDELLKKYNLDRNGQAEVSLDILNNLFKDAKDRYRTCKISLGGSGLNTIRILVSLCPDQTNDLMFFGAIGEDQNGKLIKEQLKRANVNACLQELKVRTGTVVCLCAGSDRSLTANAGAAIKCEKNFIESHLENFTNDPMYYIEGFFIQDKMDIIRYIHEKFSNSLFVTNLNAPYIVKNFQKEITWMVKRAHIIFGNKDEFEELSLMNGYFDTKDLIAELLSSMKSSNRRKIIVITDGANPVEYYEARGSNVVETGSVPVYPVKQSQIVDTTGAGDSFVAGFLFAFMKGKSVKDCIDVGCSISAEVIKCFGCNLPQDFSI